MSAEGKLSLYTTKGEVPEDDYSVRIGSTRIAREGSDLTIISNSYMSVISVEAAGLLAKRYGVECEVIDLRSISPLDKKTILNSVKKTNRVAVIHEACKQGGIAGELISAIQAESFDYLDCPVLRICAPDTPVPSSPEHEDHFIPDVERIIKEINKNLLY
jgi:pyruvate/2-oxoglutarate/acetoin dehydrogenase E1 component